LQIGHNILQLFEFPVDVIGPIDVLGLPGAVAIHDALVDAAILRFHLLQISPAPGDADELAHFFLAPRKNLFHVFARAIYSSDYLYGLGDRSSDRLSRVYYDFIDGFVDGELQYGSEFLADLKHVLIEESADDGGVRGE